MILSIYVSFFVLFSQYLCHAHLVTMETCALEDADVKTTTHVTSRMDIVTQGVRLDILGMNAMMVSDKHFYYPF